MNMKYYFAPMEGITGYLYRNAHREFFPHVDRYFIPFLVPNQKKCFRARERNDILPEHNQGLEAIPQILTNKAEEFLAAAGELERYGYREVNLNLGCPSRTVVSKGRGSGFLGNPEQLERFLEEIFEKTDMEISIKTRIGKDSPKEFGRLLEIYGKYPLKELIIHPRIQQDFYRNRPNLEVFGESLRLCSCPVCYNGDIRTVKDAQALKKKFPEIGCIMLGRGLLANPGLAGELQEKAPADRERLRAFHDRLYWGYREVFSGEKNVLFKMKEFWTYLVLNFEDAEKYAKKIRKAQKLSGYEAAVNDLFEKCRPVREHPPSWIESEPLL